MKTKWQLAVGLAIAFLMLSLIVACASPRNPLYVYHNGAIEVGGDGEPIELVNNPKATNPTYAELLNFIKEDSTDEHYYFERLSGKFASLSYLCSDFAEAVHNNAEAAGIRAAWIALDFEGEKIGHALNAFETSDKGLVFIDCTGGNIGGPQRLVQLYEGTLAESPQSWDAIAYVKIGEEYGLIPLDNAERLSYQFYQEYKKRWQEFETFLSDYNEEVVKFNQEVTGRIYIIGSAEWQKMKEWETNIELQKKQLDQLSEGLNEFWFERSGVVKDIHIHWGNS